MQTEKMTSLERRAVICYSSIMALRMIGLFMVLPVFAIYASHLAGATGAQIGLAMGVYGLSQALFQIPFGALSDHFGRKPIIALGLIIFIVGSILSAIAPNMTWLIIGRALQGVGAVGSTILAAIADLTREEQRSKSMAIAGISIGFSFSIAMLAGPILSQWMAINQLFYFAAGFGGLAIVLLYTKTPTPTHTTWHRDTEPELSSFLKLLKSGELAKLNIGIFILHAIFTASFIVIPISLLQEAHLAAKQQWLLYLPTLLVAFCLALFLISLAERQQKVKPYFICGILMMIAAELLFWFAGSHLLITAGGLCLFFAGFSLLEAFLPSLVSRVAPAARKGSALGIYSSAQFLGIFIGGAAGGWIYGKLHFSGVYLFCVILALIWFALALLMQPPRYLITRTLRLSPAQQQRWATIASQLRAIPGIVETVLIAEDNMAYLKMEKSTAQHPDFIHLQTQLQSE